MQKKQFIIQGMHCASCVISIEKALQKTPGVKNASVNFAAEKAFIEYEDGTPNKIIKKSVENLGYKLIEAGPDTRAEHLPQNKKDSREEHDHHKTLKEAEVRLLRKKFIFGSISSLFVIILSFPDYFPFLDFKISDSIRFSFLLILSAPVEFWVGYGFWRGTFYGLKNFNANMDTLVALGTGAAFFFSAAATIMEIVGVNNFDVYYQAKREK